MPRFEPEYPQASISSRMSLTLAALRSSPNALARHYTRFRVAERLLLTGHSHQAWPDCAERGQALSFADAADLVDEKWGRAFEKAARVRRAIASLLDDDNGYIALAPNTHELIVRFLSALPIARRPRIVSTDGEFHTIRRQLDRLREERFVEIVRIPASPATTLTQRLAHELAASPDRTSAVLLSSVLFGSAHIVTDFPAIADACRRAGAELLVDVYHHLNVVPFSVRELSLASAFIVGGGYKYLQLGEGNCFLRFPRDCTLRPIVTGWFSEFTLLEKRHGSSPLGYGQAEDRFAGATYDPTSHYRAAEVFDFFEAENLTPPFLREVSRHQVGLLARLFDDADLDPAVISRDRTVPSTQVAGFLALQSPHAEVLSGALRARGVLTDYRGDVLRLGPAPYLSDAQLENAMALLKESCTALRK